MASFQGSARGYSADPRKTSVEAAEFPMLCETCLGPNPYVKMMKESYGRECKICTRPFVVFRWKPGGDGTRYKKTEICQTCARVKNVCQTCLLDLQYGLPVQVRDQTLAEADRQATIIPRSDVNREYTASMQERAIENGDVDRIYESEHGNKGLAEKLSRKGPFYERNRTHVCSFFVRGECTRGAYCPYRHEMIEENELSQQNLKDRYYGVNDPVAEKMLRGVEGETGKRFGAPDPPADQSIKTLFVGGVTGLVTEKELRENFQKSGDVSSIRMIADKGIAFVEMTSRQAAEAAVLALHGRLNISGARLSVKWARPQKGREDDRPGQDLMPNQGLEAKVDGSSLLPTQGLAKAENFSSSAGSAAAANAGAIARDAKGNPIGNYGMPYGVPGGDYMQLPPLGTSYAQTPPPGKASKGRKASAVVGLPAMHYPSQDPNQLGSSTGKTPKAAGQERK
eukprot:Plantae.Rhodophyta-Purpureofilum_apyrenoidigerum.ctg25862.p1 GENE.Plantae.Rhodophyta-Purpureofilum_apyrenoidigerum.ctg25862~~Plantae.Rhodophyta-Purpureofilum_apyrenoidigerum.ctg25862.p1  ORF type:complete len:490 (-),score=54.12 Plantae.Rhodophyta-Purpureofilum_apyrenoidigerum.ctg25862:75-1436(-)